VHADKRYVDCQRCGAMVVVARWPEHLGQHASGELKTLSVAESMEVNRIAHLLAPSVMPEDFGPTSEEES
jgi:hypothetical protein